jgi:hypothetical protein
MVGYSVHAVPRVTARHFLAGALSLIVACASLLAMGTQAFAVNKIMIVKTAIDNDIDSGQTASFQIVVSTFGYQIDAVTVTDQLPPGTWTLGSGGDEAACSISATNMLFCDFGTIFPAPAPTSRTITVNHTTTDADCPSITNTAVVHTPESAEETGSELDDNSSTATITVHCAPPPPPPGGNITPTGTTCQQFRDGTAADLNAILYGLKSGVINNVAPGIGFYFVRWTSTGAAISIVQTDNGSTPAFGVQSVQVYTASDCTRVDRGLSISTGTTTTIGGTTSGTEYIARLAFDPNTVKGSADPGTVTYTYTTTGIANSTDTILLAPKP